MTDYRWARVTEAANIPLREGRAVQLGPLDVAVFNVDGRFLAIDNRCPHSGGPLCDGIVSGLSVVCPLHAWKISLEDGTVQRPSGVGTAPVTTYPVRVEEGIVVVGIERRALCPVAAPVQAAEGLLAEGDHQATERLSITATPSTMSISSRRLIGFEM